MQSFDAEDLAAEHPWAADLVRHLTSDAAMLGRCGRADFAFRPLLVHGSRADVRHRALFSALADAVGIGFSAWSPADAGDLAWRPPAARREIRLFEDVERWPREALAAIEADLRTGWTDDVLPVFVSARENDVPARLAAMLASAPIGDALAHPETTAWMRFSEVTGS